MAKPDPAVTAHLEWLGFVQPIGLVVSAPALARAGAILERSDAEGQRRLRECLGLEDGKRESEPFPPLRDFRDFAERVLGWRFSPRWYAGTLEQPIPPELVVDLPDYDESLRPDLAVREPEPAEGGPAWQLLVRVLEPGRDFESLARGRGGLEVSAHGRMERLLRRTGVPAGLLVGGEALRLISAPPGESSGWLDFRFSEMAGTAGRPILAALRLLLGETRLLSLPRPKRLAALLEESRKYQNEVSEQLAEQVLHALYELLRGFQAAHDVSHRELLGEVLAERPDEVYRGLLTVILRLVFLLYAEERELLPQEETFTRHYSLSGLHQRLQSDAALFPDTLDQRYSAWAGLLVLFRAIHDGADCGSMRLPPRHGVLFDPDRFPFLEGRAASAGARQVHERIEPPLVPDGTIWRALEKLLVLDGERISYRALDVEQIGSVYETMMGFRLETATGRSVAIRASKRHGAPTTVDLERLLGEPPARRKKTFQERSGRKLTERVAASVKEAASLADLHAALDPLIEKEATPDLVARGAMVLQPSEERRRSGSHYTPRSLTEPIVRQTLEPILDRLRGPGGRPPRPEEILELKVCDPAMGSGAFLVEACRQLADALVESWHAHDAVPEVPPDEDEVILARRRVAQRCLCGVDRNPVAVDLAKVSLWLATLAREHPLTFLDHALRHGDSLVGLSRRQIERFHWEPDTPAFQDGFQAVAVGEQLARVASLRARIREAGEETGDWELRNLFDEAELELSRTRLLGDLAVAAYFEGRKPTEREVKRKLYAAAVAGGEAERHRGELEERRHADPPLVPFHWPIEFPEVFDREPPGFDAVVGNPPFAGKNTLANGNVARYADWLKLAHPGSHGNADLVAHFFRRAFDLAREGGAFGLIATNTVAQGDTRSSGLRWICRHGGTIFRARRRRRWPGLAAVVVSVLHVAKGLFEGPRLLDGREVERISAFLFHRGGDDDPKRLASNARKSFQGSVVLGMGFTFDDRDKKGVATPIAEMERLLAERPACREVIFPYIGGKEVNESPTHAHHRYVIALGERGEEECRRRWPELMAIVEAKVKPERMRDNREVRKKHWWRFGETAPALHAAIAGLERVLVIARVGQYGGFTFLPGGMVCSEQLIVFPLPTYAAFCALQSRPHELWARFFGSSMKDDLRYTPSDCFETFPFPEGWESAPALEAPGHACYEHRAALMVRRREGLTKTYNRFHDPEERGEDILELRRLHAAMDRAVLAAYGWEDIPTRCEFLLDFEEEEEASGRNRKKPYRYRWPDEVRDEVLARLLELNSERARAEERAGLGAAKAMPSRGRAAPRRGRARGGAG